MSDLFEAGIDGEIGEVGEGPEARIDHDPVTAGVGEGNVGEGQIAIGFTLEGDTFDGTTGGCG